MGSPWNTRPRGYDRDGRPWPHHTEQHFSDGLHERHSRGEDYERHEAPFTGCQEQIMGMGHHEQNMGFLEQNIDPRLLRQGEAEVFSAGEHTGFAQSPRPRESSRRPALEIRGFGKGQERYGQGRSGFLSADEGTSFEEFPDTEVPSPHLACEMDDSDFRQQQFGQVQYNNFSSEFHIPFGGSFGAGEPSLPPATKTNGFGTQPMYNLNPDAVFDFDPSRHQDESANLPIQQTQDQTPFADPPSYNPTSFQPQNAVPTASMASPFPCDLLVRSAGPSRFSVPAQGESSKRAGKRRRVDDPAPVQRPLRFNGFQHKCLGFFNPAGKGKACQKTVRRTNDPCGLRCDKCYDRYIKINAGPRDYAVDPRLTIEDAWRALYPHYDRLRVDGDDVDQERLRMHDYITALVTAISTPYASNGSGDKQDNQRVAQQTKFNRKPYDSSQYTDANVNYRLLLLWQCAVSYHAGGPSSYDVGGDNNGYGEDISMTFSQRLNFICSLLMTDKDIVMDIIEGRGCRAIVENPDKYQRRKRDNKKSNDKKGNLQAKGKAAVAAEQERRSAPPPEDNDDDDVDLYDLGDLDRFQG